VYQEVRTKLVGNVPWANLSQNDQTYPSLKLNSYGDKDKRSFKEESVASSEREVLPNVNVQENILEMKVIVF
jgi:hypothetical protein